MKVNEALQLPSRLRRRLGGTKKLPPVVASREQETFVFGNAYAFNYFSSAKYLMVRTI